MYLLFVLSVHAVEKLRAKLDNLRAERRECEAQKEEMVRHVKGLQGKLIQEKETGKAIPPRPEMTDICLGGFT